MLRRIAAAAALFFSVCNMSAALAESTNFQTFWKAFSMAAARDDRAALQAMTKFPFVFDDAPREAGDFNKIYKVLFDSKARACLAKALPRKDRDSYDAFCGEVIYVFSKEGGAWRFSDFSPND